MKKIVLLSLLCILISNINAQTNEISGFNDIITLQTGEDIKCKVLEVGIIEIKYQKEGITPIYSVLKSDVFSITYPNGTKDVFTSNEPEMEDEVTDSDYKENLYLVGKEDAIKYYHGENCGSGGTVVTTLLISPLFGLIPAFACASTEPSIENLNIPEQDPSIGENQDYLNGYIEQAHDIKKRKIWTSYGISAGISIVIVSLILAGQ